MALQPSTHNPQLEEAGGSGRVFNASLSHSDGTKVAKHTMTVYHRTTVMVSRGLNNSGYIIIALMQVGSLYIMLKSLIKT